MKESELDRLIAEMSPEETAGLLFALTERAASLLDEAQKRDFIVRLIGSAGDTKTASMVSL
jgi:hypothetical protein